MDFKKAFDCIEHASIWRALKEQKVPTVCVKVLRELYRNQEGRVMTGAESRAFKIGRGTKQGDPISPSSSMPSCKAFSEDSVKGGRAPRVASQLVSGG